MNLLFDLGIILVLVGLLVKSADLVANVFVHIARQYRVGEFLIGFLVLGVLTSLPEVAVAINSTQTGAASLSLGNLMGATLVLLTLVVGGNAFLYNGIPFKGRYNTHEILITLFVIALPLFALVDQDLSWGEGVLLIFAYGALALHLRSIYKLRRHSDTRPTINKLSLRIMLEVAIGVAGLIFVSDLIVDRALFLAEQLAVNEALVGIFLLAIGTNLPEIAVLFRANSASKERFAIGNFLGSATANTAIVGLIGILQPGIDVDRAKFLPVMVVLAITIVIFGILSRTQAGLSRREGIILILLYFGLIAAEVIIN